MIKEGHKSFTYNLELNEEQARTVLNVLEFYARMAIGQWNEVGRQFLDLKDDMYVEKTDELKRGMAKLRKIVYPELPEDMSASYGVSAIPKACAAWEILEVLRHSMAWAKHPEGGYTVDFGRPISFSGKPLAKCAAVKSTEEK